MRKIKLVFFITLFFSLNVLATLPEKTIQLDGYEFNTHNVDVESLGDGVFEFTILPTSEGWPQVHFMPTFISSSSNNAKFVIEQIYPKGEFPKRANFAFFPKEIANSIPLQNSLKDNKPHVYDIGLNEEGVFTHFSINAHAPEDKIVLRVSDISVTYNQDFDDQPIKAKEEPLPAVRFKGKPFFPIGALDMASRDGNEFIDSGFLAAGGNIGIIGTLGLPGHKHYEKYRQPVLYNNLEKFTSNPDYDDIALVVHIGHALWMDSSESETDGFGGYFKPVLGKEIAKRKEILASDVRKLSNNPNIMGYWIDEPENLVYPYYKKTREEEWEKTKDVGLSEKMIEWSKWVNEVVNKEHPKAKMMPTLAWSTTYEPAGAMYDINIPNDYSSGLPEKLLYNINNDAYKAVIAARKLGNGRTVIYMPGMFDILDNYAPANIAEQRYACFAPLTRGAMGVFGWRLRRCTQEYRDKVVYPVMREVANLKDYFLGSWHDELVTSSHDEATAEYLQRYKERVTMVQGGDDSQLVEDKASVPDVSYCLRKIDGEGKYLLLAVNNRKERQEVTFRIKLDKLPVVAVDALDQHQVRFNGNKFTDSFEPYGVHAYIIEP